MFSIWKRKNCGAGFWNAKLDSRSGRRHFIGRYSGGWGSFKGRIMVTESTTALGSDSYYTNLLSATESRFIHSMWYAIDLWILSFPNAHMFSSYFYFWPGRHMCKSTVIVKVRGYPVCHSVYSLTYANRWLDQVSIPRLHVWVFLLCSMICGIWEVKLLCLLFCLSLFLLLPWLIFLFEFESEFDNCLIYPLTSVDNLQL